MIKVRLKFFKHNTSVAILLLSMLISFNYAVAQTSVRGTVTDSKGAPLPGVTVKVKGGQQASSTDVNGKFTINAASGATLVFNYIGFDNKEVAVGNQTELTVTLTENRQALEDVVVIGYGTRKKSDLTGAVNSIQSKDIVSARATNTQEALQGRLPGVDIKRGSGKPGSDFSIEIRGANSIGAGNTQPLYVIDGIPVGQNGSATNPINDINPADIERIDILKDASSTAIYGSRGANGVVLVTTKRGNKGTTQITYDGYTGIVNPYHLPPTMDGPTFVNYVRDYFNELPRATAIRNNQPIPVTNIPDANLFSATELSNIANGTYTNWVDLIKRNGISANHNLSITGGDDKTNYFISAGYQSYEGAMKVESTKKYTLKAGLDKTLGVIKTGASLYGTFADINPSSGEVFRSAYRLRPTGSAYNADGSERFFVYESEAQITNPLIDFKNEIRRQQYVHILPNIYAEATLFKGLKLRTSFSPDITFQRQGQYNDTFSKQQLGTAPNKGQSSSNQWVNYTWDNLLVYANEIGKHKFDITLGNSFESHQQDNSSISVTGLPYRSLWYNLGTATTINGQAPIITVASNYSKQNITSYYGRANYTFNNRYIFTATMRADGNSIFAPGNKWGYFPSGAFAWIMSEEGFLKNVKTINSLKLRLSYGQSGNAAFSSFLFPYFTQAVAGQTFYDFNGGGANGFSPRVVNPDITWEKTDEYNAGVDANILNNRVSLQVDVYRKQSKGAIFNREIPAANGQNTVPYNLGLVRNSGIEVGINTTNVRGTNFNWTTSLNFAVNKNKVIDLTGDRKTNLVGNNLFIGEKARVAYQYKILGVYQNEELEEAKKYNKIPGQYKIEDISGPNGVPDGKIDANDRQIIGSDIPDWFGGITNSVSYKNFDFSVAAYTRQGTYENSVFLEQAMNGDQTRARFGAFDRNYWTPTNPSTQWANQAIETDGFSRTAAQFQNSSYIKISNITLGYTIPKKTLSKVGIKTLRVYASALNPFIFSDFIGWDPENPSGNSFLNQDFRTRTFMLGVNLTL